MKRIVCILFLLAAANFAWSQTINGRVVDKNGEAVSGASLFVQEISQGTATNANGEFELKVAAGKYTCIFQHLAYETQTINVVVPQTQALTIVLQDKIYDISEVLIGKNREDPAYSIMRNAISRAPVYRKQVQHYVSTTYVRGNMHIEKMGSFFRTIGSKEIKAYKIKDGDTFLRESVSETTFEAPDKYTYKLKATKNNFPEFAGDLSDDDIGMERTIEGSIYDDSETSPLGHNAFSNYKYKYEGEFIENDRVVNKIKITPRIKTASFVSGYIYIFEGTWNVHSYEFEHKSSMMSGMEKQTFSEVRPDVWLPTSASMNGNVAAFGAKIQINFVSSIQYKKLKINQVDFNKTVAQKDIKTLRYTKAQKKVEKLAQKQNLTNRDAAKINKYLAQMEEERRAENDTTTHKRGKYELPDENENSVIIKDSVNKSLGSDYWNAVRPIPLLDYEVESYVARDSLRQNKVDTTKSNVSRTLNKFRISDVIFGSSYKLGDSMSINYSGFTGLNANSGIFDFQRPYLDFNAVDGWVLGQEISFRKVMKNSMSYGATLRGDYAFKRKKAMFAGGFYFRYNPKLHGMAYVMVASRSADFNGNGTSFSVNRLSSVIFKNNLINLYNSKRIVLANNIDLANGLVFIARATFDKSEQLWNTTNNSWFNRKKDYRPNEPLNPYVLANPSYIGDARSLVFSATLSYTPCMYYRMQGKNKYDVKSDYPRISLSWKHGQPNVFNSTSDFDLLSFNVSQNLPAGYFNRFYYSVGAGKFVNNKSMHFSDFAHMMPIEDQRMFTTFADDYKYYQPYALSTNEWYVYAKSAFSSSRLLLKRLSLPIIKNEMVRENLYLNYFRSPYVKHFTELGYSINNLMMIFNVGVFCGFEKFEYKTIRVKIGLNLDANFY